RQGIAVTETGRIRNCISQLSPRGRQTGGVRGFRRVSEAVGASCRLCSTNTADREGLLSIDRRRGCWTTASRPKAREATPRIRRQRVGGWVGWWRFHGGEAGRDGSGRDGFAVDERLAVWRPGGVGGIGGECALARAVKRGRAAVGRTWVGASGQ